MKLYIQDCGWRGSIIVIANNQVEARLIMQGLSNYDSESLVEEKEIHLGFVYATWGDS